MNTPAFDPDDPRLTAYALGESDATEREAIERILDASPEARAEVERIAAFARTLETEYRLENDAYWKNRPAGPAPDKVVNFPAARRPAGRRPAFALAWKIAAVVVLLAALIPLAWHRPSSRQIRTLASSQPSVTTPPPAPGAPSPTETARTADAVSQTDAPSDVDHGPTLAAAPEASANPAPENTPPLLAMDSDRLRSDDSVARPPAPGAASESPSAEFSTRRQAAAAVSKPEVAGAPATASGGGSVMPIDRVGRSLVRIRTADGSYIGGVVITTDGWILAARSLPVGGASSAVILADGREVSATVAREESGGWCRLRIDAATLPAVALAATAPADKAALAVASTDRNTGTTRFSSARAEVTRAEAHVQWDGRPPTHDESALVFNLNGELLATADTPPVSKAQMRAQPTPLPPQPAGARVRPFTAAERALLQPATGNRSR